MTLQTILDPERAASSIRVISLSPGPTETPMGAKMNQGVPCPSAGYRAGPLRKLVRGDTMLEIDTLRMEQHGGGAPTTLAAGRAPGESGVSVLSVRFDGGMHLLATGARCHCICFQMSQVRVEKRSVAHYEHRAGSLSITPSGCDIAADADEDAEILVVAVDPGRMALAAAECALPEARLIERMYGDDPALFALARTLAYESIHNYPSGALSWNEAASSFVDGLVAGHTAAMPARSRGSLGKDQLQRLRDYVVAHLDEPIGVEALADIAARSPFHFTRVFTRSVGMTPHRYVVHLRLQRAIELVREGRSGLAEIAARTGFADQSHLSRWVRRVHGVPLSRLTA
jgi:AraC family transcriptional regulator